MVVMSVVVLVIVVFDFGFIEIYENIDYGDC